MHGDDGWSVLSGYAIEAALFTSLGHVETSSCYLVINTTLLMYKYITVSQCFMSIFNNYVGAILHSGGWCV